MKYYVLYNPLAGKGDYAEKIEKLTAPYSDTCVLVNLTELNDYGSFVAGLEKDDEIVLCGGDGTINRFVNDTEGIEIENEILYYPTGTGNDFVRDLKDEDVTKAFSIKKYIKDLPTVEVNGKTYRFLNGVGFGIDGYCCEVGDKKKAKGKRKINYTMIAICGLLFKYKPTSAVVTVDGVRHEYKKAWIAPTMNGRFYGGGMMATPDQDRLAHDGVTAMLFHDSGKLKTLWVFKSIFNGGHVKHPEMVTQLKGREITVEFSEPRSVQVDGETILNVKTYTVKA